LFASHFGRRAEQRIEETLAHVAVEAHVARSEWIATAGSIAFELASHRPTLRAVDRRERVEIRRTRVDHLANLRLEGDRIGSCAGRGW